jgi:hypothetical protein
MSWNYRVIVSRDVSIVGVDSYALSEVFYGKRGKIEGWTEPGMNPYGDTLKELRSDLRLMCLALKQPVLEVKNGKLVRAKP